MEDADFNAACNKNTADCHTIQNICDSNDCSGGTATNCSSCVGASQKNCCSGGGGGGECSVDADCTDPEKIRKKYIVVPVNVKLVVVEVEVDRVLFRDLKY
jgi:hypothetical protein